MSLSWWDGVWSRATRATGDCIVSVVYDEAEGTETRTIERADQSVKIDDATLASLSRRGWAGEGLFVIHGVNGTVRYALDEYDPLSKTWTAHLLSSSLRVGDAL